MRMGIGVRDGEKIEKTVKRECESTQKGKGRGKTEGKTMSKWWEKEDISFDCWKHCRIFYELGKKKKQHKKNTPKQSKSNIGNSIASFNQRCKKQTVSKGTRLKSEAKVFQRSPFSMKTLSKYLINCPQSLKQS